MFRGKESSNRIELSRLVQDLLNFGVLGSLQLWGWGAWMDGVGGGWRVPPTHVHTHMHTHMCMHTHARVLNMIISCKWLPPLGKPLGIPYDVICACACMHVRAYTCMYTYVGGTLSPPPTPIHPPPTPQRGDPQNQSKFNST